MKSIKLRILVTQDIRRQFATTRKQYFWPGMKKDMAKYISRCMKCQQVKVEHQHPIGLLQPFPISEWKWEVIFMDFITGLVMTWRQHDSIMVLVDKLTKATHFILVKSMHKTDDTLHYLNPKYDDRIRHHPTFRTDVSDNNQSTECRQQNIYSFVDYPTLCS